MRNTFKKMLATPYALFMALFVILPIILIAVYAFIDSDGAFTLLGNFKELAKEKSLDNVIKNSVIAGLSTSVICLLIGYPIAYYLTKKEFNRTGVMIGLFLVPMWVNFLLRMMSTKAVFGVLGIPLGMRTDRLREAIERTPDAKAVLVNNPTYYGICSDMRGIVQLAHAHGMKVLADEAHGTHFYFGRDLPVSAMEAGADIASVSMHKSGGSLTQSSFLLTGKNMNPGYIRQIINLTQTTSASYLLLSSLDISRRNLALRGESSFKMVTDLAEYAREEINKIGDYYAFGREMVNGDSIYDFDPTKLSIHTLDIGLAGIEVYDILRDEYDIQIEFGDLGNILAYLSIGDRIREVERLVTALADLRRRYKKDKAGMLSQEYIAPKVVMTPQDSFYAEKESLPLKETKGRICSEFVMCYPPGIPVLAPGEEITDEIIDYIVYAKEKGCSMTGPEDEKIERLNVLV